MTCLQHPCDAFRALYRVVRRTALVQEPREQGRKGEDVAGEDQRLHGEREDVLCDAVSVQGQLEVADAAREDEGADQAVETRHVQPVARVVHAAVRGRRGVHVAQLQAPVDELVRPQQHAVRFGLVQALENLKCQVQVHGRAHDAHTRRECGKTRLCAFAFPCCVG